MKGEKIFAKDPKTGHYRYMDKKEFYKKNRPMKIITTFFYLLCLTAVIGMGYYSYCDVFDVYLVNKDVTIDNGSTYQVELLPKNSKYFDYDNYVFESENPSVATVDSYGQVTAVGDGQTNINVKFKNGIEKKTLAVNVSKIDVEKVELDKVININKNESKVIKVKVNNNEKINTDINYESSNKNVIKVDDFGNITGVSEGEAVITAKAKNGKTTKSKVVVKSVDTVIEDVNIDTTSLALKKGNVQALSVNVTPSNANTKNLTWISSNPSIVSVSSSGVITAKKSGEATITAKTSDGNNSICVVNVDEDKYIVLSSYNEEMTVGQTQKITANTIVSWSSSNSDVASVDLNGNVTAKKIGLATISATDSNGNVKKCLIKVKEKVINVDSVNITDSTINMYTGDKRTLSYTITPSTATNKKVLFSSSNPSVATVSLNGNITALSAGTASITASSSNGITDSVLVNVKQKPVNPTSIVIDKTDINLVVGESTTINVGFIPLNTTNRTLTFTSSNSNVTVDSTGKITAKKIGTSQITIKTSNNLTATVNVNVSKKIINLTNLSLQKKHIVLKVGETTKIEANLYPFNTTQTNISWSSSDDDIASVDNNGVVTAKDVGIAEITATSSNGISSICVVEVQEVTAESITLNKSSVNIKVGSSTILVATISPENTTYKNVTWSSSNTKVATVNQSGKVVGKASGTATITAKTTNGLTATTKVVVSNVIPTKITISQKNITLKEGQQIIMKTTYTPSNVTVKKLVWSSSDTSVATINQSGVLTAVKSGQALITAAYYNNANIKAEVIVNVESPSIEVENIYLDKSNLKLPLGSSNQLIATITPDNATNKTVKWTSSNPSIVSVDQNGKITANSVGTTTIVAASNNNKIVKCYVTVYDSSIRVSSVKITNNGTTSVTVGSSIYLTATVSPENAGDKKIIWNSSDKNVATVNSSGKVTAVSEGTVKITAVSNDSPKVTDSKTIIVRPLVVDVASVKINSDISSMYVGDTFQMNATVFPSNATNKNVSWSSSNTSVLDVSQDGKITAKSEGIAKITVTSLDNSAKTDTKEITVTKKIINVSSIALNRASATISVGGHYQLNVSFTPNNATNKKITWSSENTSIAKVDSSGKVTGVKAGSVNIVATSNDGAKKVKSLITVVTPSNKIVTDATQYNLLKGKSAQIVVTQLPLNDSVTFTSGNKDIVTVDSNGKITATGGGYALITVKSNKDSNIYAKAYVSVDYPYFKKCTQYKKSLSYDSSDGTKVNVYPCIETENYFFQNFAITDKYIYESRSLHGTWCKENQTFEFEGKTNNCEIRSFMSTKYTSGNRILRRDINTGKYIMNRIELAGHGQSFDVTNTDEIFTNYFPINIMKGTYSGIVHIGSHTTGVAYINKMNTTNDKLVFPDIAMSVKNNGKVSKFTSSNTLGSDKYYEDVFNVGNSDDAIKGHEMGIDEEHNKVALLNHEVTSNKRRPVYIYNYSDFKSGTVNPIKTVYFDKICGNKQSCGGQGLEMYGDYIYTIQDTTINGEYYVSVTKIKHDTCPTSENDTKVCSYENLLIKGSDWGDGLFESEGLSIYNGKLYAAARVNGNSDTLKPQTFTYLLLDGF